MMNYNERSEIFEATPNHNFIPIHFDQMDLEDKFLYEYLDLHLSNIINKTVEKFGLLPTHLVFVSDMDINGFALPGQDFSFIGITTGFVHRLKELLQEIPNLFEGDELRVLEIMSKSGNVPIEILPIQMCLLYIIHHELGHIFQFTNHENFNIPLPAIIPKTEYDFDRHCMEIDADTYCAIQLARYTLLWIQRISNEYIIDQKFIQSIINTFICTILTYRLFLLQNAKDFYLKKYQHPHLTIRITNILSAFITYLSNELINEKYAHLNIDMQNVEEEAMNFLEEYSFKVLNNDAVQILRQHIQKHRPEITVYRNEILDTIRESNLYAMNSWNEFIKKKNT